MRIGSSKDIKQISSVGGIIIQSKYILDIVRKMPSDLINFEVIDGLKIKIYTPFLKNNVVSAKKIFYIKFLFKNI